MALTSDIAGPSNPNGLVTLTTDQTITGKKTFSADAVFQTITIGGGAGRRISATGTLEMYAGGTGGIVLQTADSNNRFYLRKPGNIDAQLSSKDLTASREFKFPNKAGTLALTSDLPSVPSVGNGTITIVQPGTSNQTFTVNQEW